MMTDAPARAPRSDRAARVATCTFVREAWRRRARRRSAE